MKISQRQKQKQYIGKSLKSKKKLVPGHVYQTVNQVEKMQAMIRDLLNPFVGRFHFFELPKTKPNKKKS